MGNKVTDELVSTVRSVIGKEFSDMDIIRALHMGNNDVTAAINIIFDTPSFGTRDRPDAQRSPEVSRQNSNPESRIVSASPEKSGSENQACSMGSVVSETPDSVLRANGALESAEPVRQSSGSANSDWWFVGSCELAGLSTCKGRKIKSGDEVTFSFPSKNSSSPSTTKFPGRGRAAAACSEIVRFSTKDSGEIGRIPNEWARCLIPLVKEKKIKIEGHCKSAPDVIGIMDTIILSISVYINSSMFRKRHQTSLKVARNLSEESVVHPLPTLFRLLGLTPFKKAEFTPEDLYMRKRPSDLKDSSGVHASSLNVDRSKKLPLQGSSAENNQECISDSDLDNIISGGDSSELEEREPPPTLQCELRPYQKQALHWMIQLEKGGCLEEAATTLHPCWDAYRLTDRREFVVYLNAFSGDATTEFPSTLHMARGGAEIETHAQPGLLALYVHYGQSRPKDAKLLAKNDVVLTTYGVLASEFSSENAKSNDGLFSVRWFRVILDEAHTIKSLRSQISMAAAALTADRRWCLTGTPIQNNLEDIYSLLRFLKVEPWGNWAWWNKLVQKPFEEGDERGLKLVQSILRSMMLRRTKFSTDREGRPILVLPPADIQVIYCELTEAEKDFYEALFKRSKVKFDQFVEQGRVLHNYASILELLLRLRQCCDHPFLVMSRGDTQEFSDLNKLAKRFLKGDKHATEGESNDVPSRAYIQEVVEELRRGEKGECPICLESFEDAVLTPCAHRLCRECLLASWRNHASGLCPVCRKTINRQDLITAPTDNRFQIDIEKNWVESSKVAVLLQELEHLRSSGSKSIVFSQWTAFLDLLQIPLSRCNFPFARLDGTLNQQQREKVIKQFSEESDILVLLMSLKAGGVGINLTAASNAFVLDPWWNPAVEEQAVMRIHRIGQTKKVTIKRFIMKGTVEERMEAVQARKQRMIAGALTDQEVRTARIEELKMLFT
ncbi:PREDICTED: putative SWI/SNF-related matrix-associated actin-dependent regulator of chromatin subfamily A member 3-like 2 isoform X3 [Nelumbo nucifera]|uniref:SWI/SNF-related matrix-associated actin-dependent regulator of chromatin subfamily A member 3-like 2 isoform X3 n=1 Tax=Nelumbo nucifera TaxID=4432 RepID=A0A1U7YT43_NELNU|nr:PREDICTED: putative SWI/SNF-related matrix-associated actin-dependent regulator of chromatin subfamily A member 3-like 2 isoform X3 [Nelumbo nucifera]